MSREKIIEEITSMNTQEKDEIIMDAVYKTVQNISMEYNISLAQVVGCLDIVKAELTKVYHATRFPDE